MGIEEAGYESLEPKIDFVETEIFKRMGEFKMTIDELQFLINKESEKYANLIEECLYEGTAFYLYKQFEGAMEACKDCGYYLLKMYIGDVYRMLDESYKKVNKAVLDSFGQETFNYCVKGVNRNETISKCRSNL